MKVSDVMSTDIITVSPSTSLRDAATIMLDAAVSGLPVTDDGKLVGIITEADFVQREAGEEPPRHRVLGVLFGSREGRTNEGTTVGEVMSTELVTVAADMRVRQAARFMVDRGVKRLPVVTDDGSLAGVISRADVMRVFVRSDTDIEGEINDLMGAGLLPVAAGDVRIEVADGVVSLGGRVDARLDADVLVDIVARMDGVLRVDSSLEWEVDNRIPSERFAGYPQEGKGD